MGLPQCGRTGPFAMATSSRSPGSFHHFVLLHHAALVLRHAVLVHVLRHFLAHLVFLHGVLFHGVFLYVFFHLAFAFGVFLHFVFFLFFILLALCGWCHALCSYVGFQLSL